MRIGGAQGQIATLCHGGNHTVRRRNRDALPPQPRVRAGCLQKIIRLFGFAAWISLLVYMINPGWMMWSALPLPGWLRWVGAGWVATAIPLLYWMFSSLGANVTDTVAVRKEHSLVTHGPYRWIRHPLYTFGFLAFVGFSLLTANWFTGVTGLIAIAMLLLRTPIEEAKLIERFGNDYREYMRRTGRFFPRLLG